MSEGVRERVSEWEGGMGDGEHSLGAFGLSRVRTHVCSIHMLDAKLKFAFIG